MTREDLIAALQGVPTVAGGVEVVVGIYVGHGQFATTEVVMVLWASDGEGGQQVVLQIPTPEGLRAVVGSIDGDYTTARVN